MWVAFQVAYAEKAEQRKTCFKHEGRRTHAFSRLRRLAISVPISRPEALEGWAVRATDRHFVSAQATAPANCPRHFLRFFDISFQAVLP